MMIKHSKVKIEKVYKDKDEVVDEIVEQELEKQKDKNKKVKKD